MGDSIDGMYKCISDCAKISKWAGGIGIHINDIRGKAARSSVLIEDKLPPNFPIGVLVPSQIYASDIKNLLCKLIIQNLYKLVNHLVPIF